MDFNGILDILNRGGTLLCLAIAVVSLVKGWVVPKWMYDEMKAAALRNAQVAEKATDVAVSAMPIPPPTPIRRGPTEP